MKSRIFHTRRTTGCWRCQRSTSPKTCRRTAEEVLMLRRAAGWRKMQRRLLGRGQQMRLGKGGPSTGRSFGRRPARSESLICLRDSGPFVGSRQHQKCHARVECVDDCHGDTHVTFDYKRIGHSFAVPFLKQAAVSWPQNGKMARRSMSLVQQSAATDVSIKRYAAWLACGDSGQVRCGSFRSVFRRIISLICIIHTELDHCRLMPWCAIMQGSTAAPRVKAKVPAVRMSISSQTISRQKSVPG